MSSAVLTPWFPLRFPVRWGEFYSTKDSKRMLVLQYVELESDGRTVKRVVEEITIPVYEPHLGKLDKPDPDREVDDK